MEHLVQVQAAATILGFQLVSAACLELYSVHPKYISGTRGCVNPLGCQTQGCCLAAFLLILSLALSAFWLLVSRFSLSLNFYTQS
jgi:hypothetical protein